MKKYSVTNTSLPHSLKKTSSFIFETMNESPFKIARRRELNTCEKSELLDIFESFGGEYRGILHKLSTDEIQENTLASLPKRLHEDIILLFNDFNKFF
jgi:Mg/Co/Ni transporter MgtE